LSFVYSGHLPEGTAFQEASARFSIEGERMHISQLELLGNALSLRGIGQMRVDGSALNLELYGLIWGRGMHLLPTLIDRIPPAISKQLMKIRVQGSLDQVKIQTEPVPILVEPVKELWQRMARREGR
jgi:hypothetical protein